MKFVNYIEENNVMTGVKLDEKIFALSKYTVDHSFHAFSMEQILADTTVLERVKKIVEKNRQDERYLVDEEGLKFAPPIQQPNKIICVGLNYKKHAEESNMPIPMYPVLFNKFSNSLAGHLETIKLPKDSLENDYEAELAIVIGKEAKNVSVESAIDYVFGFCTANDLSSRDLQFRTGQWLLGKALDQFCPIGPYVVTADEVGNPNDLSIKTYLNGELRQNSNTADMIFKCYEIVSYISQYITLNIGDIILTGTPEGVIMGYPKNQRQYLKAGDEVVIEIEKLGKLINVLA